jgi:hypothetical protein
MLPTRQDAIGMYARFCMTRYGANAGKEVKSRAHQLAKRGDKDGEKIWHEVAVAIEKRYATSGTSLRRDKNRLEVLNFQATQREHVT